jgi:hypothetical protein
MLYRQLLKKSVVCVGIDIGSKSERRDTDEPAVEPQNGWRSYIGNISACKKTRVSLRMDLAFTQNATRGGIISLGPDGFWPGTPDRTATHLFWHFPWLS